MVATTASEAAARPDHVPAGPKGARAVTASHGRWLTVAALTAVGLVLRLVWLDRQSLWLDEVLTVLNSHTSLTQLVTAPAVDPNIPPLYYVLMHFVTRLGSSEIVLRFPSMLFGVLSIPLLYAVTRRWAGHSAALLAALALTVSPFHIWYSQEARPYALLLVLALAALWLLQGLREQPRNRLLATGFVLSAAATFYVHTVALPFLACLGLYVLLVAPRREWGYWAGLGCMIAILLVPAVYRLAVIPPDVSANEHYQFQPAHVAYALWAFGTGYSLGPNLLELRTEGMGSVIRRAEVLAPAFGLLMVILVAGAIHLWRTGRRRFWIVAALVWLPIAFAIIGGVITAHPFNVRYAILAFPAFVALLGIGLSAIPAGWVRGGAILALLTISGASLANYYADPRYQREDTRAAVRFLNRNAGDGALVLATAPYMTLALKHYGLREDLALVAYPANGRTIRPGTDDSLKADLSARFVAADQVSGDLDGIIARRSGLWVFLSRTFHSDPHGAIIRTLDGRMRRDAEFTAAGVRVVHYTSAPDRGS